MNAHSPEASYDAINTLARSLFGFALAAWLPLAITWILLLLAPAPPIESYAQLQWSIVSGAGIAALILLALAIWTYRLEASRSARIAQRLAALFCRPWFALALVLLLVEVNGFALILARGIAPSITGPGRFLLLCWSLVFGGLLLTLHWRNLQVAYVRSRGVLAVGCIALTAAIALALLLVVTSRLIEHYGLGDRLRGSLDYRPLQFIDDGAAPQSREFWAEQSQTRVRWLPLSYWAVEPIAGEFINVSEQGLRRTVSNASIADSPLVFFFGGSAIWGEGARDAYTIPSQVAQLLQANGIPARVQNYGQTGYVSAQDLVLFQAQLARGNTPDIAVFYQGFNDVLSAQLQDVSGLPYHELQRASDAEAGRLLRQGQPILQALPSWPQQVDWSLVATAGATAEHILDRWLANRRLIRAAGREFGVDVIFVWQPTLFVKSPLTEFETSVLAENDRELPGFSALYRDVDRRLRDRMSAEAWADVVLLSDIFNNLAGDIFVDNVHIHELGNQQVAKAIWRLIADRIGGE